MPLFHRFFLLLLLACSLAFGGCPSPQQTVKPVDTVVVAPPVVQLSADAVHSPAGDMTVKIPVGWVAMDIEQLQTPQVFSVACDPSYTMSLVMGEIPMDNNVRAAYDASGLKGLAEISFQRRWKGSQSRARMEGLVEEFELGKRRFAAYSYTTDGGATLTRVAVFFTATRLYECAIANLTFTDREPADAKMMEEILRLVLASAMW
ncbi:MAG: hypothetical protein K1X90_06985 [Candidatus Kapabacteria bacterium]|nr:hypothetical protein [Candidatus Kapabacteria bacterium]